MRLAVTLLILLSCGVALTGCGRSDAPSGKYVLHRKATIKHRLDVMQQAISRERDPGQAMGLSFLGSIQAELVRENVNQTETTLRLKSSGIATIDESFGGVKGLALVGKWERLQGDDAAWVRIDFGRERLYAIKEDGLLRICTDRRKPFESTVIMMHKPWF